MDDVYHQLQLYATQLWRKRWYIVLVAYLICVGGWTTVATLQDRFESQARVYVDTDSLLSPLLRGISVESNVPQQVDFMQRTLLSRPNLEKLIRMADLDLLINNQADKEKFLADLAKRISINTSGRNLFNVKFNDGKPEAAQRVVQALLSIFVESNVGQSRADIEKARQFLDAQINEYEKQLQAGENRLAAFKKANLDFLGNTAITFTQRVEQLRLQKGEVAGQLEEARSRRDSLRRDLSDTPQFLEIDAPTREAPIIISTGSTIEQQSAAVLAIHSRVQEAEKALDAMLLRYTEKHPDIVALRKQLVSLNQQFEQTKADEKKKADEAKKSGEQPGAGGGRENWAIPGVNGGNGKKQLLPNQLYEQLRIKLSEADANFETLERRLATLNDELSKSEGKAIRATQIEAEFSTLNRDYGVLKKNYDELTSRRESARIADAVETKGEKIQFRIVDPPQVPTLPSGPPRLILMSAVLAAALGAGVVIAFLMSQLDDSFVSISRLKDTVAIPVLGSVTMIQSAADRRLKLLGTMSFAASIAVLVMAYGYLAYLTLTLSRVSLPFT
jgi:polysaccharide chain length determinant protein (PEP-CTERM system associated)